MASDHDLSGGVEVCQSDGLTLRGLAAGLIETGFLETENSRHGTGAQRHGFLHRLPAKSDEIHGSTKFQRACTDQCGELAEAVTRDDARQCPAAPTPEAPGSNARR